MVDVLHSRPNFSTVLKLEKKSSLGEVLLIFQLGHPEMANRYKEVNRYKGEYRGYFGLSPSGAHDPLDQRWCRGPLESQSEPFT